MVTFPITGANQAWYRYADITAVWDMCLVGRGMNQFFAAGPLQLAFLLQRQFQLFVI
jgi:hypothetical protein